MSSIVFSYQGAGAVPSACLGLSSSCCGVLFTLMTTARTGKIDLTAQSSLGSLGPAEHPLFTEFYHSLGMCTLPNSPSTPLGSRNRQHCCDGQCLLDLAVESPGICSDCIPHVSARVINLYYINIITEGRRLPTAV